MSIKGPQHFNWSSDELLTSLTGRLTGRDPSKAKPKYSTRWCDTFAFLAVVKMSCYNCHQNGARRCTRCLHVTYCSRECQTQHWSRHRENCIPSQFSLSALFDACRMDVFPIPCVKCDYGFDNMQLFHGDVMTPEGLSAETILLGLYQVIWKDIGNDEYDGGAHYPVLNSIGASKRMILKAYERNALDEFLHKYINSVLARVGERGTSHYCIAWLQNKLVIGPTRLLLSDEVGLTGAQIKRMRNEIHQRYYGFVN